LINAIEWNKLVDSNGFNGRNYQSQIGDYTFFHCVAPYIIADTTGQFAIGNLTRGASPNRFRDELIATCDTSLAICLNDNDAVKSGNAIDFYYRDSNIGRGDTINSFEYSMLCNIRRNIVPYGGFTKYSRDNSTYTQHGYYYDSTYTGEIEMFDGDTTVSTYEFVTAHKWHEATHSSARSTIVC
jgi:hypothetical protein